MAELHVLVNNSGRTYEAPLEEHSDQAWDDLMTLNVRRVFTLVQALTPLLEVGAKAGVGRIINVSAPTASQEVQPCSRWKVHADE